MGGDRQQCLFPAYSILVTQSRTFRLYQQTTYSGPRHPFILELACFPEGHCLYVRVRRARPVESVIVVCLTKHRKSSRPSEASDSRYGAPRESLRRHAGNKRIANEATRSPMCLQCPPSLSYTRQDIYIGCSTVKSERHEEVHSAGITWMVSDF